MFMDWNTQSCQNVNSQIHVQIQHDPNQNFSRYFVLEIDKLILIFLSGNAKGKKNSKQYSFLKKKKKLEVYIPDIKTYYKAIIIKTM